MFAVLTMADYERLRKSDDGKCHTLPHDNVVKMNLGQGYSLLKAWRTHFGLSQSELAHKAKCTQAQIANFKAEKQIPSADTLLRLSQALAVSADLLIEIEN